MCKHAAALGLAAFGAVLTAALLAFFDAEAVEGAADDVVADARKVAYAAATDEDDGVLLEVVPLATDVGGYFFAVAEAHASDLAESGVGFFGCLRADDEADAASLRAGGQVACFFACGLDLAWLADELIDRGHALSVVNREWPNVADRHT